MKYLIENITENETLREVLFLFGSNNHDIFLENYHTLRTKHNAVDHHDPMWMIYMHLSEYASGHISREETLNSIIEHSREVGFIK